MSKELSPDKLVCGKGATGAVISRNIEVAWLRSAISAIRLLRIRSSVVASVQTSSESRDRMPEARGLIVFRLISL
jgi:hypothetical protein